MTTPDFCQHERPQGSQLTAAGVRVCFSCGKPIKPAPKGATMKPDVQDLRRKVDRLRRDLLARLDEIDNAIASLD